MGSLRRECFEILHTHPYSGHHGVNKSTALALRSFWWPGIRPYIAEQCPYIAEECASCTSCQKVKHSTQRPFGLLKPLQIAGRRWESVSMDFIMDLPETQDTKFDAILVVCDRLSKMAHLIPTNKTVTPAQVAFLFQDAIFKHHGYPTNLVSDRDPRFTSTFWEEWCKLNGVHLNMSSARHAQADGQTEVTNRVVEDMLRHYSAGPHKQWDRFLPAVYNHSWHSSVKNTPFMLNYGQNPDTPTLAFLRTKFPELRQFTGR